MRRRKRRTWWRRCWRADTVCGRRSAVGNGCGSRLCADLPGCTSGAHHGDAEGTERDTERPAARAAAARTSTRAGVERGRSRGVRYQPPTPPEGLRGVLRAVRYQPPTPRRGGAGVEGRVRYQPPTPGPGPGKRRHLSILRHPHGPSPVVATDPARSRPRRTGKTTFSATLVARTPRSVATKADASSGCRTGARCLCRLPRRGCRGRPRNLTKVKTTPSAISYPNVASGPWACGRCGLVAPDSVSAGARSRPCFPIASLSVPSVTPW